MRLIRLTIEQETRPLPDKKGIIRILPKEQIKLIEKNIGHIIRSELVNRGE